MFKTVFLVAILLIIFSIPSSAQDNTQLTFRTDDDAIELSHPEDWAVSEHSITFNTYYEIRLTYPRNQSPLLLDLQPSQIFIEVINSETHKDYEGLTSAAAFAMHTFESFFGSEAELEELAIGDYDAVSINDVENFGGSQLTSLYAFMLNEKWVVLASITAPQEPSETLGNDLVHGEAALLPILDSLSFDEEAAVTVHNLERYDTSSVALGATYTTPDSVFSFQYPEEWELKDAHEDSMFNAFLRSIDFTTADETVQISIYVLQPGNSMFNQPLDQDTPEEYLSSRHSIPNGSVQEFRIGEYDAVSVSVEGDEAHQEIVFVIANRWIAGAVLSGAESADVYAIYEPSVVAVLESIEFVIGADIVNLPSISAELPIPWEVASAFTDNDFASFVIASYDDTQFSESAIRIILATRQDIQIADDMPLNLPDLMLHFTPDNTETETLTIAEYEVLQTAIIVDDSEPQTFYDVITLVRVDDEWFVAITARTATESYIPELLEIVDIIIVNMDIHLRFQR